MKEPSRWRLTNASGFVGTGSGLCLAYGLRDGGGGWMGVTVSTARPRSRRSSCPWSWPGQSSAIPRQVQCPVAPRTLLTAPPRRPRPHGHGWLPGWTHGLAPISAAAAAGAQPQSVRLQQQGPSPNRCGCSSRDPAPIGAAAAAGAQPQL